jgi:putative DNA primase/helicase
LLDTLNATFEKYLVLPPHAAAAIALWVLHTWAIEAFDISPYLAVRSPERRCGKTTLLKLLNRLTRRAVQSSSITPAALFRYVEAKSPTLLIDEFDAAQKDNEDMRGILNSGHSGEVAYTIRCVGDDNHPKRFSTWGPKAIAAIKRIADTLMDRSIIVGMRRKKKTESRVRYRDRDDEFKVLRGQALRWANDNSEKLRHAEPEIPNALNDRAADNWRPLLAIADLAGGKWPTLACEAARALSGDSAADDTEGVELLADIRASFGERNVDRLFSADLVAMLVAMEGRPWAEFRGGKPLTQSSLARLLKPFRVAPTTIRIGERTAKGYQLSDFRECFEAYLGHAGEAEPSHRNKADEMDTSHPLENVTPQSMLRFEKRQKPARNGDCDGVTVAAPLLCRGLRSLRQAWCNAASPHREHTRGSLVASGVRASMGGHGDTR